MAHCSPHSVDIVCCTKDPMPFFQEYGMAFQGTNIELNLEQFYIPKIPTPFAVLWFFSFLFLKL